MIDTMKVRQGISETPLVKKLGIQAGARLYVKNSPFEYSMLLGTLPDRCKLLTRMTGNLDVIHIFTASRNELREFLQTAKKSIKEDGMIWVSWPKKSSKVETDVTEDVIREVCLPMDLVDIKVCAIDETWSGLKLVIRKEKR
jgi:hypothetical protein